MTAGRADLMSVCLHCCHGEHAPIYPLSNNLNVCQSCS